MPAVPTSGAQTGDGVSRTRGVSIGIDGRPTIDGRLLCDGVAPPAESPVAEARGVAVDADTDADPDSDRSTPNAGGTGQAYRCRKRRSDAFWEDQHHATAVETGAHLARCVVYVDLNMVRAGGGDHAAAWNVDGYHETQQERARYRVVDRTALAEALGVALRDGRTRRERRCTDSLAVGSRGFVEQLRNELGARVRHGARDPHDGAYVLLREGAAAYGRHSAGGTASLNIETAPCGALLS